MLGVKGDGAPEVEALIALFEGPEPLSVSPVSNLVIAKPLGTLLEPLALRFFEEGPNDAVGEV